MFIDLAVLLTYVFLFGVCIILVRALIKEIDRQRPRAPMRFEAPPPSSKKSTVSRLNQPPTTGYKPRNKPAVSVYTAKKTQTVQPPKPALPPVPAAGSPVPDIYKPKPKSKSKSKQSKTPPKAQLPPAAARTNIPDSLPLLSEQPVPPKPRDLFVKDKTRRKLMTLTRDRATAERLLKLTREYNPHRSEQWCYEKVIYDLERDRRA